MGTRPQPAHRAPACPLPGRSAAPPGAPREKRTTIMITGSAHCEYVYTNPTSLPSPRPRAARLNRLLLTTRMAARRRLGQAPPPAAISPPPPAAAAVLRLLLLRPEATATSSASRAPPPAAPVTTGHPASSSLEASILQPGPTRRRPAVSRVRRLPCNDATFGPAVHPNNLYLKNPHSNCTVTKYQ